MFYIEKNDKPNFLERKLNLVKIKDNTIMLSITENIKDKRLEKMALKTKKLVQKHSNSKKIVLSNEIKKQEIYINYLNSYGLDIQDGRWLFEILLPQIVEYIVNKKNIEIDKNIISILINDLVDVEFENIKLLAHKYKNINIVTNHIEKFKKLEESLNEEGIIITITNNKKKSLIKSQIILNIDFPKELINKYNIKEDAIIVNIRGKIKISNKRLNVNDYEIDYREDKKEEKDFSNKYNLKDIYESKLYRKQNIEQIRNNIKIDKLIVNKLFLNNGEL